MIETSNENRTCTSLWWWGMDKMRKQRASWSAFALHIPGREMFSKRAGRVVPPQTTWGPPSGPGGPVPAHCVCFLFLPCLCCLLVLRWPCAADRTWNSRCYIPMNKIRKALSIQMMQVSYRNESHHHHHRWFSVSIVVEPNVTLAVLCCLFTSCHGLIYLSLLHSFTRNVWRCLLAETAKKKNDMIDDAMGPEAHSAMETERNICFPSRLNQPTLAKFNSVQCGALFSQK